MKLATGLFAVKTNLSLRAANRQLTTLILVAIVGCVLSFDSGLAHAQKKINKLEITNMHNAWTNHGNMMRPDWRAKMSYEVNYEFEGAGPDDGHMTITETMQELVDEQTTGQEDVPVHTGKYEEFQLLRGLQIVFSAKLRVGVGPGKVEKTIGQNFDTPTGQPTAYIYDSKGKITAPNTATIWIKGMYTLPVPPMGTFNRWEYVNFVTGENLPIDHTFLSPDMCAGIQSLSWEVPSNDPSYYPAGDGQGGMLFPLGMKLNGSIVAYDYIYLNPN